MMTRLRAFPFSPFVWLFAFICALYPVNEWQLELMAVAVTTLFLWSCHRLSAQSKTGMSIPRAPILICVALLWLLSLFSIAWSGVPWISMMSFCFMSALPISFLTLSIAPFSIKEWRVIGGGLCAIIGALALWAVIQIFTMPEMILGRARHPLADPNSLAGLFNLSFIAALGAMLSAKGNRLSIALSLLGALIFSGMMATGSRSGALFLLVALIIFLPLVWRQVRTKIRPVMILIVFSLAGFFLTQAAPYSTKSLSAYMQQTINGLMENDISSLDSRLRVWEAGLEVIKDAPLTGHGVGTFFLYYPEYRQVNEPDNITHAHSDPLQFWAEMGIAAPILFYLMLIFCAVRMFRAEKKIANWTAFCALLVMLAQSHMNLNLYNLSILCLCGLVMAYWFDQTRSDKDNVIVLSAERYKIVQALLAVLVAAPLVIYWPIIASEHYFNKARSALWQGDMERFGQYLLRADALGFQSNHRVYQFAVNVPMAVLEQREDLPVEKQQELYEQITDNLAESEKLNPRSAATQYFRGKVQQLVDPSIVPEGTPAPESYYKEALRLDPSHLGARMALIDLYLAKNDPHAAADIVKGGIQFTYNTEMAVQFYARAIMVFTLTGDQFGQDDVRARMKVLDQRLTFAKKMAADRREE